MFPEMGSPHTDVKMLYVFIISALKRAQFSRLIVIKDGGDHIRILLYSYYTNTTGWGVHLRHIQLRGFQGLSGG